MSPSKAREWKDNRTAKNHGTYLEVSSLSSITDVLSPIPIVTETGATSQGEKEGKAMRTGDKIQAFSSNMAEKTVTQTLGKNCKEKANLFRKHKPLSNQITPEECSNENINKGSSQSSVCPVFSKQIVPKGRSSVQLLNKKDLVTCTETRPKPFDVHSPLIAPHTIVDGGAFSVVLPTVPVEETFEDIIENSVAQDDEHCKNVVTLTPAEKSESGGIENLPNPSCSLLSKAITPARAGGMRRGSKEFKALARAGVCNISATKTPKKTLGQKLGKNFKTTFLQEA